MTVVDTYVLIKLFVLWSCSAPSVLRSNVFLSACSPVVWEEMRKSLKAQEVQIREHQIWEVQTLLDKVTRKLHLDWKVPFGGMNPWRFGTFQDLWENHSVLFLWPCPSLASCLGTGRQYKLIRGQQYCIIGICIALSATAVTRKKVNSTAAALWPNQLPVRSLFWE